MYVIQGEEAGFLSALERKVRERNCYLPKIQDLEISGVPWFIPGVSRNQDIIIRDVGTQPDLGPQISSPEESGEQELDTTLTEQGVGKPDGAKQVDDVKAVGKTVEKELSLKAKSGCKKKIRKSQLELLGVSSNQLVSGLGLQSGRMRAGSNTHLEMDSEQGEGEDNPYIEEDEDGEF